ncbi:MAG: 3-deoxy-D-manno-octulosonic acid transferase [Caulobacteraceae bacterium]
MNASRPFFLKAYAGATRALSPLAPAILASRARRGKEDWFRLSERLGRPSLARPGGQLAWLHGASVGEGLSLLPLVARLRELRPNLAILVTSGTRASAEVLSARLPPGSFHQYTPLDTPQAVAGFIGHWRPDLGVFLESELWPNLILAAKESGARLALVSAKMSKASARGWHRFPHAAAATLAAFDLILARDEAAAEQFRALGADVEGVWDAKLGAPPLPADPAALAALETQFAGRPVILAASTHAGEPASEEATVLAAFDQADPLPDALLVLAPRHPARGDEIVALVHKGGYSIARRSRGESPSDARVYLADTLGELGLFMRLARLTIVGGSLIRGGGGHNPLEPARLGSPFVSGLRTEHWPVYAEFLAAHATRQVESSDELAPLITEALAGGLMEMAERASAVVGRLDGQTCAVVPWLLELLGQ